jgi:Protein of unknown function (DUF3551)
MTTQRAALILVVLVAASTLGPRDSAAQYSPWCVEYIGRDGGGATCIFSSLEQCRMTATPGTGGHCIQNPWYGQGPGQSGQGRRR